MCFFSKVGILAEWLIKFNREWVTVSAFKRGTGAHHRFGEGYKSNHMISSKLYQP
ncbi:hypothetical protein [Mucilaginibacter hurinus]|uniref:hypothetical protein n=1 Tax=Mucilaginibacter hurinus TaxID=2201324 RepID=UPI0013145A9B|nr:hypothetical protein [Mucilaginibacter hurinus]